jgi:hypothetical protein
MHLRNLLILAGSCCVAPLTAQEGAAANPIQHESDCPYERARLAAAEASQPAPKIDAAIPEGSVFDHSQHSPALLP